MNLALDQARQAHAMAEVPIGAVIARQGEIIGVGYNQTISHCDLKKAKDVLLAMVAADERILKDPAPTVAVAQLADSSVNFVVRPWVTSADYWAVKFDFTEAVTLRFDAEGISIPFPQMDVHLTKEA